MKKRFALIIGVILAVALCLSACSNPTTSVNARWSADESYVFDIELADFDTNETATEWFNKEMHEGAAYYKDSLISSLESVTLTTADEVRPVNAKGKYALDLTHPTTTECELKTKQTLYVQYKSEYVTTLECYEQLKKFIIAADAEGNPFSNHDGLVTLRSVTETSVIFGNDAQQAPSKSFTKVDGFYLGKEHQGITEYEISTEYDLSNKLAKIKLNDEEAVDHKLSNTNIIDSNQILLYVRSLGKTADDFQNTPSVAVFNAYTAVFSPYTKPIVTASFALTRELNVILNNGGSCYVKLNAVSVSLGGAPFMIQYNVPDSLAEKSLDLDGSAISTTAKKSKYTTLRFRVGNLSYELTSHDPEIISALTAPASTEE